MTAKERPQITRAEMDVMKALWLHGPANVREIGTVLKRQRRIWAYTTTQTLLNRLETKGYVTCDRGSVPHVFAAAVSREGLMRLRLRDLADEFCDGAASPLVAALVGDKRFTRAEIDGFRKLIDKLGKKS